MYSWESGAVTVVDSIASARPISGDELCQRFMTSIDTVTLGIIRLRDRTQYLGPLVMHRFGPPKVDKHSVTWPIGGGLLSAAPGGRITIESTPTELKAIVEGYRPALPRTVYEATQLRLHHALVRVQLLRLAGLPAPRTPAPPPSRIAAAAIDVGVCAGLALLFSRRHRARAFTGIAIGYHLACWTTSGQTLGGRVMRHRVVALDGSRLSLLQSVLRLASLPLSAMRRHAAHDDIAATAVVQDTAV